MARVRVRGGRHSPSAKGSQEHLGASRGLRERLETGKVLGEGSKTYFIYVWRPSVLIKSVWFLHHHGGARVESLVKNCNGHGGGFAVRQVVSKTSEETTDQRMIFPPTWQRIHSWGISTDSTTLMAKSVSAWMRRNTIMRKSNVHVWIRYILASSSGA